MSDDTIHATILAALRTLESERSVAKLREIRDALEERAFDDAYHNNLDDLSCAFNDDDLELANGFNKILWDLRDLCTKKIEMREAMGWAINGQPIST
tara:strand:- start:5661 stop:5951 length:291 start_codon:yes stop_codon:yes gene_type:complete